MLHPDPSGNGQTETFDPEYWTAIESDEFEQRPPEYITVDEEEAIKDAYEYNRSMWDNPMPMQEGEDW